ncbi:hypothetical protein Tco_0638584 [Tanacetum coccineum]
MFDVLNCFSGAKLGLIYDAKMDLCAMLTLRTISWEYIMAASAIAISSDSLDESVGSPPSRVIKFFFFLLIIPMLFFYFCSCSRGTPPPPNLQLLVISSVAPVVETTLVASPTGLCGLIPYSNSNSDSPDEISSSKHISPLPAISPFLCTDSSEAPDSFDGPPSQDHPVPFVVITLLVGEAGYNTSSSSSEFPIDSVTARLRPSTMSTSSSSFGFFANSFLRFGLHQDHAHSGSLSRDVSLDCGYPLSEEHHDEDLSSGVDPSFILHILFVGPCVRQEDVRDDIEEYEADTSAGDTVEVGIDPMSAPIVKEEIIEPAREDFSDLSGTKDGIVRSFEDMSIDLDDAVLTARVVGLSAALEASPGCVETKILNSGMEMTIGGDGIWMCVCVEWIMVWYWKWNNRGRQRDGNGGNRNCEWKRPDRLVRIVSPIVPLHPNTALLHRDPLSLPPNPHPRALITTGHTLTRSARPALTARTLSSKPLEWMLVYALSGGSYEYGILKCTCREMRSQKIETSPRGGKDRVEKFFGGLPDKYPRDVLLTLLEGLSQVKNQNMGTKRVLSTPSPPPPPNSNHYARGIAYAHLGGGDEPMSSNTVCVCSKILEKLSRREELYAKFRSASAFGCLNGIISWTRDNQVSEDFYVDPAKSESESRTWESSKNPE